MSVKKRRQYDKDFKRYAVRLTALNVYQQVNNLTKRKVSVRFLVDSLFRPLFYFLYYLPYISAFTLFRARPQVINS